jgi:DNA adenine methylase
MNRIADYWPARKAEGILRSPLKWHGGKHYVAKRIIALMPPHTHYVEPYAGSLAVLLAKDPEGVSEVVNDLNEDLTNFWMVLQTSSGFERFKRIVEAVPFSEWCWQDAVDYPGREPLERAVRFFVHCRQSLAGRMDTFAPLSKNRTRRGMNEQAAAWLSAVEGLTEVHARLKRVVILNRPATLVIEQQDGPNTLFYIDPPYLHDTRTSTDTYGPYEMDLDAHSKLVNLLREVKGKVMLSGYQDELYHILELLGWKRHAFDLPNHAAGGRNKRRMTECVWCNF